MNDNYLNAARTVELWNKIKSQIGGSGTANLAPNTLLIDIMQGVPIVGEKHIVPSDQIYGKDPKVGDMLLYIRFTPTAIYWAFVEVTGYISDEWKIDFEFKYVSEMNLPSLSPGIFLYGSVADPIQKNHYTIVTENFFVGPLPKVEDAGCGLLSYDKKLYSVIYHVSDISSDGLFTIIYDSDPELIGPSDSTVTAGDGLSKNGDTLSVDIPVRDLTEDEYNSLSEEEKAKGLIFLPDDEGGGSSSGEVYSTEEIRIGSWIDGKPLYRIVWNLKLPSSVTQSGQYVKIHDKIQNGLVKMTRVYASMYDGIWEPIPATSLSNLLTKYFYSNNDSEYMGIPSGLSVHVQNANYLGRDIVVILEYTKTTD